MKKWASLAIAAAFVFGPMTAHADMKALEEAAKKEGELTWYVAHYTSEGAEELGAAFTKMYGIKVNVVRTTAQVAYQRLTQDIKNNQTICDVFSSTDIGHYVRLKAEGRLEKYIARGDAPRSPRRSATSIPDGYFHTTSGGTGAAHLQHLQGEGRGRAQEVDRPARSQVEGQGLDRPSRLLGLCRHLGADHAQAVWLGLFREAGEEQAADRPLDQRHGDGAQLPASARSPPAPTARRCSAPHAAIRWRSSIRATARC